MFVMWHVGNRIRKLPFGDDLYNPFMDLWMFMVSFGIAYYWVYHMAQIKAVFLQIEYSVPDIRCSKQVNYSNKYAF